MDIIKKQPKDLWPDFIDINLGCPVKKVTSAGSGSALLKDLDNLKDYMSKIVKASIWPVTAKIRLGWDEKHINVYDTIKVLEESGVSMIGVHARTTKQLYSGKPNYDLLKDLQSKMSVPLVVSGDIFTLDDAIKAIDITGAAAVMVARGGMGNPTLIKQIKHYYETGERLPDASLDEQKKYCLELAEMMCSDKGEERAMKFFRTIGPRFFNGFSNSKSIKIEISTKIQTYGELVDILAKYQG
jgi:nifR3 family TIM-barrel protein